MFDREIAEQLLEKVPEDYDGNIKLQEFKEVYLEGNLTIF